jgi:hypothetical protein
MAEYSDTELDDAGATIEPIDDNAQATEADFDQMSPEPKMIGTDELQDRSGNKLAAVDDEIVNMQSLQLAHPKPAPKPPRSKRVLDTLRRYPE